MKSKNLQKKIQGSEKKLKKLLKELISKKTVNPPGNEYLVTGLLEEFLKEKNIEFKEFEREKNRTNLIASVGSGEPELMIAVHSDVVPAGPNWKTNPFNAVEKNGKIYGRGAVDNKGPLAASIIFLTVMKEIEKSLKGKISVLVAADEEKGSVLGTEFLLKEKLIKPNYVIVPDVFTENKKLSIGEKGLLHLKAVAQGKQAHASEPKKGINAISRMNSFLLDLGEWKMPFEKKALFSEPTQNIGTIEGGEAVNIVPAECEAGIDIRYLPNQKGEGIVKKIKKIAKKHKVKVFLTEHQKPFLLNKNTPLIESLTKSTESVKGKKPIITGESGTTVAKKFALHGIPAVGFGPGEQVAHMSNEFIETRQLVEFGEILTLTARELLS